MYGHGEAEFRHRGGVNFVPALQIIARAENAVVVLDPPHLGVGGTLHHHVCVLNIGIVLLVGWHEFRAQAVTRHPPAFPAVFGQRHAPAGDRHTDTIGIARIDTDRMQRRIDRAAAHPFRTRRQAPQRVVVRPGLAVVARVKQRCRRGADPQGAGLASPFHRPDAIDRRRLRILVAAVFLGELGRRQLRPTHAAVGRAVQLGAEVAEVQCGKHRLVVGRCQR